MEDMLKELFDNIKSESNSAYNYNDKQRDKYVRGLVKDIQTEMEKNELKELESLKSFYCVSLM